MIDELDARILETEAAGSNAQAMRIVRDFRHRLASLAAPPVAPAEAAVPERVLALILARLDPAGQRLVQERSRLHQRDLLMAAAIPPSPATATVAADSSMRFLIDIAQLLEALGEHAEADRLMRRFLVLHAPSSGAWSTLTVELFERGLVQLGAISSQGERLARFRSDGYFDFWCSWWGPYWDGLPLGGKSIFVLQDEGLGDRLWYARYLSWLADEMGGRVIVGAGPQLARLLRRTPGVAASIEEAPHGPGRAISDTWVLPVGLAALHSARYETVPREPYVFADPALVAWWRPYVAGGRVVVGVNWAGDPLGVEDRDIPLSAFAPLARVPGIRWIALQKTLSIHPEWERPSDGGHELDPAPPGLNLVRLGPKFADYADTGAVVTQLDLVITSDTSVVHLAAAMGKPVWMLLHTENAYIWGRAPYVDVEAHAPSVWCPSMRIFRALPGEGWGPVMQRVADELARLVATRGAA